MFSSTGRNWCARGRRYVYGRSFVLVLCGITFGRRIKSFTEGAEQGLIVRAHSTVKAGIRRSMDRITGRAEAAIVGRGGR